MDPYSSSPPSRRSRFRSGGAPHRPGTGSGPVETTPEGEVEPEVYAEHSEGNATEIAAQEAALAGEGDYADAAVEEYPTEGYPSGEYPPEPLPGYGKEHPATELPAQTPSAPAAAVTDQDSDLLPAFRLTRSADDWTSRRRVITLPGGWWTAFVVIGFLICAVIGYFIGLAQPRDTGRTGANRALPGPTPAGLAALPPAVLKQVDDAFNATKQRRFDDARQLFDALYASHRDWPEMLVESGRAALYARDYEGAGKILAPLIRDNPDADAVFLLALLHMTVQEPDKAEELFARAVSIEPARADIFYFWGECLRREGKPQEAADRFRSALLRNQYETADGLYQLKLWMSEIQADQEVKSGSAAEIDADLASPHPSWAGYFAAAARAMKGSNFKDAAGFILKAQSQMDPAVFNVILQDPTFAQESFRAELTPIYKQQ